MDRDGPLHWPVQPSGAVLEVRQSLKVALTGATGYTGGRLLRALRARGDEVFALARPASVTSELRSSGAVVVEGDLADAASLARLVEGSDAVLHVAAV